MSENREVEMDHHVATYLAQVAAALESVPKCDPGYGEFYVSEALVSFDGEHTQYAVVADEHGGYAVRVSPQPSTSELTPDAQTRETERKNVRD